MNHWKHKFDHKLEKVLQVIESVIAVAVTLVLIGVLCVQLFHFISEPAALVEHGGLSEFLHEMLTIVVGLEFVKLLMHVTPENVLEVLIMAVARHFVVGNGTAAENIMNVASVLLCTAGLIAIHKFRMTDRDLHKKEMKDAAQEAKEEAAVAEK